MCWTGSGWKSFWKRLRNIWAERSPDYLPSRLSLAEMLTDRPAAIEEYRQVLRLRPNYIAARIALARLLADNRQPDDAIQELRAKD